jgi:hypothetical protein
MGQILHGCASITETERGAIQKSQESIKALYFEPDNHCKMVQTAFCS